MIIFGKNCPQKSVAANHPYELNRNFDSDNQHCIFLNGENDLLPDQQILLYSGQKHLRGLLVGMLLGSTSSR